MKEVKKTTKETWKLKENNKENPYPPLEKKKQTKKKISCAAPFILYITGKRQSSSGSAKKKP